MPDLFIDFETFSRVDITKTSTWKYASDESTEILCLAYAIDDGPVRLWKPGDTDPRWFSRIAEYTVHAHNAAFEWLVWELHCVPRLGWPPIRPDQWECTAARVAVLALPRSLDGAAKALGVAEQKDKAGHRAMLRACKPDRFGERLTPDTHPELFDVIYEYCRQDVAAERAIWRATPPMLQAEQAVWQLDQLINRRGVPVAIGDIDHALAILQDYDKEQTEILRRITGGVVTSPGQGARLVEWLNSHGYNVDNIQASTVAGLLDSEDLTPNVRKVLTMRRNLSKSSTKKLQALKSWETDGRVRGAHLYHAATTGRFGGRGPQFQNVPRGRLSPAEVETVLQATRQGSELFAMLYPDVPETLSSCLRAMVKAPAGKALGVVDFAAIEARVLAWLATDQQLLSGFIEGVDSYVEMASAIYDTAPEHVSKAQRFVGKIAILGLGYGMGAAKFAATCKAWGAGEISEEFAQEIVDTYRVRHAPIKRLWRRIDTAMKHVVETGRPAIVGRVTFAQVSRWLQCILPSGRAISWYEPRVEDVRASWGDKVPQVTFSGVNSSFQWGRCSTYGGKAVENITQAVARDLLVAAMQRLERHGFEVVTHVHDEVIVECLPGSLPRIEELMTMIPRWAVGCPIAVEGFEAERYRK